MRSTNRYVGAVSNVFPTFHPGQGFLDLSQRDQFTPPFLLLFVTFVVMKQTNALFQSFNDRLAFLQYN